MRRKFIGYIFILFLPLIALGETVYDQPYLGGFPAFYAERFSVSAWRKAESEGLAKVIADSNLIVLAEAESIVQGTETSERSTVYEANVRILQTLKGKAPKSELFLKFTPYTTGLDKGARHIFFLKVSNSGVTVLKSSYIFPPGQGYDNHMRLFGAIDCSADLGSDVISYLISGKSPNNIDERLAKEYTSRSSYSAVHMAAALSPVFGRPVLTKVVAESNPQGFDPDLYGVAAYTLARQNPEYLRVILDNIPLTKNYGRIPESIGFDIAANVGNEDTVLIIRDLVSRKPEFAVSAAFALSRIGGEAAGLVIDGWLKDPNLANRKERIFNGWTDRVESYSSLFQEAQRKMRGSEDRE